jgi:hypothetical protein
MAYILQNILGLRSKLKIQLLVSPGGTCSSTVEDVIVRGHVTVLCVLNACEL